MICQISAIPQKSKAAKTTTQAVSIQQVPSKPGAGIPTGPLLADDTFWSPMTAGPYLVPVSRWIE